MAHLLVCKLATPEEIFQDRVLKYTGIYKIKIDFNGFQFYHPQEFYIRSEAGMEVCKLRAKGFIATIDDVKNFRKS